MHDLQLGPALQDRLAAALSAAPPARLEDGGAIAEGFDGELDAERRLRDDSRRVVTGLQLDYAQRYGVASLKIRHHAQFGYVMEVPAAAADALKARPELSLRQSMASAARFSHPELADLDRRITEAAGRASAREAAIFASLSADVLAQAQPLRRAAAALAMLDVLQGCARAGGAGQLVPARGHGGHGLLRHRRPAPGGGGGAASRHGIPAQRLRPFAVAAGPAAHRAEYGRQIHVPAAERAARHPGTGRLAGAGGECPDRRGRPPVQPRGGGGRPGARPLARS